MQVLIYTHAFPPMVGGIETITMELARRLAMAADSPQNEGLRVTVVTPARESAANEADLPFEIVRKPNLKQLIRLVRGADILHIAGTDMSPLLLGWLLRKYTVVEHHGFQTACPNGQLIYEPAQAACPGHFMARRYGQCLRCNASSGRILSLKSWLLTFPRRWLCSRAHANVMPTAWLGDILQLPKLVTIHHGLPANNPSTFAAQPSSERPSVVFLGRLVSTKGVQVLLEAAAELNDCEFQVDIIGKGPERTRLEAAARALGLQDRVVFHGFLSPDKINNALSAARVVVMPSLAGEVFGLVALENMLRQKPLIVSEIGSLSEVVGDAGLTFPVGDAKALAARLRKVLQSGRFSDEMGIRAFHRATSVFTPERMVDDHLALYHKLFGAKSTSNVNVVSTPDSLISAQ